MASKTSRRESLPPLVVIDPFLNPRPPPALCRCARHSDSDAAGRSVSESHFHMLQRLALRRELERTKRLRDKPTAARARAAEVVAKAPYHRDRQATRRNGGRRAVRVALPNASAS